VQALIAQGYTVTHHPAAWQDIGNAERGPKVVGHHAYDEWISPQQDYYVILEGGVVIDSGNIVETEDILF
jgi:hypothetical protein